MIEAVTKTVAKADKQEGRSVQLIIQSRLLVLTGSWEWTIQSDTVICSDVMLVAALDETGTKGIIHPDDLALVKETLKADNETHPFSLQFRMITTYGEVHKLLGFNISIQSSQDIAPELNVLKKAKHLKQLEKENEILHLSGALLQQAELIGQMGTWFTNAATNETYYSDNVFGIHGVAPQSLNAHLDTFWHFIHPADRVIATEYMQVAHKLLLPLHIEYRIVRPDGQERLLRHITHWIQNNKGENILLGVIQDYTDQNTINQEANLRRQLAERKQLIEALVDNNVDRIMALAKDMTLLVWNKSCEQYYGVKKEEAIGNSFLKVFPKAYQQTNVLHAIERAFEGEPCFMAPEKETHVNSIAERFYIPLKQDDGSVYSVLCIIHDVTKAVTAKEELTALNKSLEQKNKELEEKNEEISSFAFIASHDLKEPLRKIHTYSHWLLDKELDHLTEKGREYTQRISNAVKRMDMLIEDIMTLTKIHSDRQHIAAINLNEILQKVKDELAPLLIQTHTQIISENLPHIQGNENQLFYLFKNILHNAIKFQHQENAPVINVETATVNAKELPSNILHANGKYVKISFIDNGIGFDPKYVKKVFQVFQRLHAKNEYSGTGMGLAICKKIMENHEGFITAESQENKGSVFSCYFKMH